MELYINSAGIVSGAGNNGIADFLKQPVDGVAGRLPAVEPDYTGQIPPMQLRRMSKAVRMGIGASKICMQQAGVEKPDAISVGTAMGCLQDTEMFLGKMVEQHEQMLTPTAFIQSTHNTVSGQIALLAGCYGHNLTFVQRGHSFEHAMMNAALYLEEHGDEQMLVGGIDELTNSSYTVMKEAGVYDDAIIAGEGAAFFMVTKKPMHADCLCVKDMVAFTETDATIAADKISSFINRHALEHPDLVLLGMSGDKRTEPVYKQLKEQFAHSAVACFKHLSGEYATASAFAVGLVNEIVVHKNIPSSIMLNGQIEQPKKILLINNYMHYVSCWYMEVV